MHVGQRSVGQGLRTLLILGRVSNLPTVWSNCLAGWVLAGGGEGIRFLLLGLGGSFLYLGGMFLNDALDARFDQQRRPERPIPSGAIRAGTVWRWGISWLGLGLACWIGLGKGPAVCGLLLVVAIVVYDAIHKIFAFAPVLMAACRFLLVLAAASAAADGVTGLSLWSAVVLGSYVLGLSFLAQRESLSATLRYWPCLFLAAPVVLALIVNRGDWQLRGALLAAVLVIWILRSIQFTYWTAQRNLGRSVAGLLAGIVLVDLLAAGPAAPGLIPTFLALFFLALILQRWAPAT